MTNSPCTTARSRATFPAGIGVPSKSGATVTRPLNKDSGFFYVPCCAGSMAPFMAGRVGASQDAPVPDSGTPTLHGLSPSIGVEGDRFTTCQSGANMANQSMPKLGNQGGTPTPSQQQRIELQQRAENALSVALHHTRQGNHHQALAKSRRAIAALSLASTQGRA